MASTPILYSGRDYLALPREPQPWLLKKLIPISGLVNLYGPPKSRKSYAALGMAEAISNPLREDWNGLPVMKHGPVVYIQADTPRPEWAGRIVRMDLHGFDISNIYFADIQTLPNLQLNVLDPDQVKRLREVIGDVKPVLTIFDTLRESFRGDENSSDIMQNVMGNLVLMTYPSSLMVISHKRKDAMMAGDRMQDDLMEDARGSGYVSGRMDNIMRLTERRLTVKGRAVRQTAWEVIPATDDYDEDDLTSPPPMIVFKDTSSDKLETAVQILIQQHPEISYAAAAKQLRSSGATTLSEDHLRKDVLPSLFKRYKGRVSAQPGGEAPPAAKAA